MLQISLYPVIPLRTRRSISRCGMQRGHPVTIQKIDAEHADAETALGTDGEARVSGRADDRGTERRFLCLERSRWWLLARRVFAVSMSRCHLNRWRPSGLLINRHMATLTESPDDVLIDRLQRGAFHT